MEERKELMGLPFGRRFRCGNFVIEKVSRALSKQEQRKARQEAGLPLDKKLRGSRASLPFIRVSTVSGAWRCEWAPPMRVYNLLDSMEYDENGLVPADLAMCANLLTMFYCDTTVVGDKQYVQARRDALLEFSNRVKASNVSEEQDAENLENVKLTHETLDTLNSMDKEHDEEGTGTGA